MNPVPLFLIIVTLPLLLGGCGGEKESVNKEPVVWRGVKWAGLNLNAGPAKEIPVTALQYKIKSDSVTITQYMDFMHLTTSELISDAGSGHYVIPEQIEGKPVTCIGRYSFDAFGGSLTHITIPDSVTSIEQDAFKFLDKLVSITIGNSVTSIGNRTFYRSKRLRAVIFLGDAPEVGALVFKGAGPTIYRKADAKGWTDTFAGRPVQLITKAP
jgi:hypothetical protein